MVSHIFNYTAMALPQAPGAMGKDIKLANWADSHQLNVGDLFSGDGIGPSMFRVVQKHLHLHTSGDLEITYLLGSLEERPVGGMT